MDESILPENTPEEKSKKRAAELKASATAAKKSKSAPGVNKPPPLSEQERQALETLISRKNCT